MFFRYWNAKSDHSVNGLTVSRRWKEFCCRIWLIILYEYMYDELRLESTSCYKLQELWFHARLNTELTLLLLILFNDHTETHILFSLNQFHFACGGFFEGKIIYSLVHCSHFIRTEWRLNCVYESIEVMRDLLTPLLRLNAFLAVLRMGSAISIIYQIIKLSIPFIRQINSIFEKIDDIELIDEFQFPHIFVPL